MTLSRLTSFQKRLISGFTLGPIFLGLLIFGNIIFTLLLLSLICLSLYEWFSLASKSNQFLSDLTIGSGYILLSFFSFFYVWQSEPYWSLFLVLCVWASDIGAYFAGKVIGGPKMAPSISPNKTWAGFIGAVIGAIIVGASCIQLLLLIEIEIFSISEIIYLGPVIAISGQVGDLLVSYFKRRANIKDTGDIIPGHGGLLDRIDSLMLASIVIAAITFT